MKLFGIEKRVSSISSMNDFRNESMWVKEKATNNQTVKILGEQSSIKKYQHSKENHLDDEYHDTLSLHNCLFTIILH